MANWDDVECGAAVNNAKRRPIACYEWLKVWLLTIDKHGNLDYVYSVLVAKKALTKLQLT